MEAIKYIQAHRNSIPWSSNKSEWYGCTSELAKGVSLNTPNFIRKNKSAMDSLTEEYKRLEKAHNNAQNKVESNQTVAYNIEIYKKEILYLTQEIVKVNRLHELMSKSAVKIQKVARGYLSRKDLEIVSFT